ncbi:uncharacterized protein LOC113492770 [Trichoplusia ni]|uniref:Uncharacterized protein LOC113492770 n=1 Tax=Trichoplusia ni TaxID=7111 RepID=A0A7E5VD72_TRINI|nr:uncharacterized protein LOC113492770 [Trichoplusia ni]
MVTLEVMSDASNTDLIIIDENFVNESTPNFDDDTLNKETGVHFLTEQMNDESTSKQNEEKEGTKETPKGRHELLEYLLRHDGSVICKMCGEVLQTRTHWYRHKYKRHAPHQTNSTPLFQCEQCFVYFKSRKGYIGHLASRHSELLSDSSPVLTNTPPETCTKAQENIQVTHEMKEEFDPEPAIPQPTEYTYQDTTIKQVPTRPTETKKSYKNKELNTVKQAEWEEKRSREEKLVADIIDRVRRECEAQPNRGSAPARRGYSRRANVMHSLRRTDALS